MRPYDHVVVLHDKIADRRRGHVQTQRLPVLAVVDREVYGLLGTAIEQSFSPRVLANCVDNAAVRYTANDLFPRLAAVMRSEDVWSQIVEAEGVDRRIGSVCVESTGVDQRHFCP